MGLIKTTNFICDNRVNNVQTKELMRLSNTVNIYMKHYEKNVVKLKEL